MQSDPPPPHRPSRASPFRVDIVIALCALLVSGLATAASWWQTRVIADQLSAQVWPYVTFTGQLGRSHVELDVANDGLGPAVIKSFVLSVDGRPQHDMVSALHALIGRVHSAGPNSTHTDLEFSTLSPGEVIRPSSSRVFFRVDNNARAARALARETKRLTLHVCYCSILANCWNVDFPGAEPKSLASCPDRHTTQLQDVPPTASGDDTI